MIYKKKKKSQWLPWPTIKFESKYDLQEVCDFPKKQNGLQEKKRDATLGYIKISKQYD